MRLLVLGGNGMLGHRLWIELNKSYETWGTIRGAADSLPPLPNIHRDRILGGIDALHFESIVSAFATAKPNVVINCIGLIKQRHSSKDTLLEIDLNARLPHQLAALCKACGSRLIHFSTDCVFLGTKGHYTETDPVDAKDIYGRSKGLGEVVDQPHCLTIRTSLIGRELNSQYGLIEWFLSQQGSAKGYQKAIFSGFPTQVVASILQEYVIPNPDLWGLYHVSSKPISKYDLLVLASKAFGHPIEIQPDSTVVIDRSLDSTRFFQATGFVSPDWHEMIKDMAVTNTAQ